MVSLTAHPPLLAAAPVDGLRPVNLKTDLAALADLIEIAFAHSMDSGGRAAIREMRAMSNVHIGLNMLANMNDMMQGVGLGYVYVADGRIVGNVSIYSASLPHRAEPASIIANVAVHPEYRGRHIARRLMEASIDAIRARGFERGRRGRRVRVSTPPMALLQVEHDNVAALHLYRTLGFVDEGTWTTWRRSSSGRVPPSPVNAPYIRHRARNEWRDELALAAYVRPLERGGVGWLRPLVSSVFYRGWWERLADGFNLRSIERLVIQPQDSPTLAASLWLESAFGASAVQMTLLVQPEYSGLYDDALLNTAVRRFGARGNMQIEHPADDVIVSALLERYGFTRLRTLTHMRWTGD